MKDKLLLPAVQTMMNGNDRRLRAVCDLAAVFDQLGVTEEALLAAFGGTQAGGPPPN